VRVDGSIRMRVRVNRSSEWKLRMRVESRRGRARIYRKVSVARQEGGRRQENLEKCCRRMFYSNEIIIVE
jgi:hypothetical protein